MIEISFGLGLIVIIGSFIVFGIIDAMLDAEGGILGLGILVTFAAMMSQHPKGEVYHHTVTTEIHSTAGNYNAISGSFFLGSGYINSREMYAGNTFDGEYYERVYIPVSGVKRKMINSDVALWHQKKCTFKSTWLFKNSDIFACKAKDILEVPTGTIIKEMKFQ